MSLKTAAFFALIGMILLTVLEAAGFLRDLTGFLRDAVAAREAQEETRVQLDRACAPWLVGIDVHGIPPKQREPFHLHHDLIWCFRAASDQCHVTTEALEVMWAEEKDWERLDLTQSIRQCIRRAAQRPAR